MEFNRAQLKQDVKLSMKAATPNPILVSLLFSVVVSVGTGLLNTILGRLLTGGVSSVSDTVMSYLYQGYTAEEALNIALLGLFRMGPGAVFGLIAGGFVLSVIVCLWQSSMGVGYEGWCLSMVRGENPPINKIFGALPMFGQVLLTRFLTGLFIYLWMLLLCVGLFVLLVAAMALAAAIGSDVLMVLLTIVIMAAFWVLGMWVMMRYALVDYVLLDKGLSGMDAIRENKRLMRGNVGKGFMLQMSFAGWYFLVLAIIYGGIILAVVPILTQASSTSMGGLIAASGFALLILAVVAIAAAVIMLWLRPYTNGCWAKFYDWACGAVDGFQRGTGFGGDPGGWGEHHDYTWSSGAGSGWGTGVGPDPRNGGAPKPPKPKDDPWN